MKDTWLKFLILSTFISFSGEQRKHYVLFISASLFFSFEVLPVLLFWFSVWRLKSATNILAREFMLFVSTSFEWPNVLSVQSLLVPSFISYLGNKRVFWGNNSSYFHAEWHYNRASDNIFLEKGWKDDSFLFFLIFEVALNMISVGILSSIISYYTNTLMGYLIFPFSFSFFF